MREEYPALADYGLLWADLDAWTATLHTMASELARGITVEVECQDCEGRGYVDTHLEATNVRINGAKVYTDPEGFVDLARLGDEPSRSSRPRSYLIGTPSPRDFYDRITSSLHTDGLAGRRPDPLGPLTIVEIAVASHSDLVDGRVTTTERRWCTCYDDPAPVLGRRTHALAGLIRAHVKREPWAAAELYVLAERLQTQGSRWGLWLAHWMVSARPRRRRRPRRWSGRAPRNRRSIAVERWLRPSHPARKELELELAMVARWARDRLRRRLEAELDFARAAIIGVNRYVSGSLASIEGSLLSVGGIETAAVRETGVGRVSVRWSGWAVPLDVATALDRSLPAGVEAVVLPRVPGYQVPATPGDRRREAEARALDLAYRRPEMLFEPSALDSLVGAPVTAALMADVDPGAPAPELLDYQREWLEGGRRVVGRVDSVSVEGDTRTGLRATARLSLDAAEVERISQAAEISAGYAAAEPAAEPARSRQGPPIGDRLARRLRRGRPR